MKIYRIRKLSERECFRLMNVRDSDIDRIQNYPRYQNEIGEWVLPEGMTEAEAEQVCPPIWIPMTEAEAKKLQISSSQQYRMAGNSIVVAVLEAIFTQLFRADSDSLF